MFALITRSRSPLEIRSTFLGRKICVLGGLDQADRFSHSWIWQMAIPSKFTKNRLADQTEFTMTTKIRRNDYS